MNFTHVMLKAGRCEKGWRGLRRQPPSALRGSCCLGCVKGTRMQPRVEGYSQSHPLFEKHIINCFPGRAGQYV